MKCLKVVILILSTLVSTVFAQAPGSKDPARILESINEGLNDRLREGRLSKRPMTYQEYNEFQIASARQAAEGVDPAKIEPTKGLLWARIFGIAQMWEKRLTA